MNLFRYFIYPIFVSLVLHAGIISLMFFHWEQKPKSKVVTPRYIEAKLVELKPKAKQAAKAPNKPKKVDLTAKRQEQEKQKKIAEQKRQAEIKQKQQKELAERKKAEAEKKKLEQARLAEVEKQQQERIQQRQEREFEQALLEEQGLLLEDTYATEAQSYVAMISQRIEQNWSRPPSARTGMQCELLIRLVPTGQVVNVDIVNSSGNAAFDRSAVQAVEKIERFPEIQQMSVEIFERYYRELRLIFNPQDLRQ